MSKQASESDLPEWAPKEKAIRSNLLFVINNASELADIKASGYTITKAKLIDGWLYVWVKRCTLEMEIKVGKFENLKSAKVEDGRLEVKYFMQTQLETKEKIKSGLWGALVGAGIVAILAVVVGFAGSAKK